MLTTGLIDRLRSLKLHGMARALEDLDATRSGAELSFEDRLTLMVDHEETERASRAVRRRLQVAKLRVAGASIEDVDLRRRKGLSRSALLGLARCEWIRAGYNVLITGKTGVGKTWLACALGERACREGFSVRYIRLPTLFASMQAARGDGTAPRLVERLGKVQLLILDDFALYPLDGEQRRDLMEIVEERAQRRSTLLTSQLPVKAWHAAFGDPTLADAVLDRLVHNAYHLELDVDKGKSLRDDGAPPELG